MIEMMEKVDVEGDDDGDCDDDNIEVDDCMAVSTKMMIQISTSLFLASTSL